MRWKIKQPKPELGDIKEEIKFAYTTKIIGDTKILWENYIEVYEYVMCKVPRPPETLSRFGKLTAEPFYHIPQWKLKELKLILKKPTIINAGYQPTDKLNNTNPPTRY